MLVFFHHNELHDHLGLKRAYDLAVGGQAAARRYDGGSARGFSSRFDVTDYSLISREAIESHPGWLSRIDDGSLAP